MSKYNRTYHLPLSPGTNNTTKSKICQERYL